MRVLSTKKLSLSQKELLLGAGLSYVEYDAIRISRLDFEVPDHIEHGIFTSKNGVESFFSGSGKKTIIDQVYCVGEKTAALLAKNGQNVIKIAQNASELADYLIKTNETGEFWYFCGNLRRDELVDALKRAKMTLFEQKAYKTERISKQMGQNFDGIMFFSPSGIRSFTSVNKPNNTKAFCIGNTTAEEAKKHFKEIWVANSHTVESLIAKTAKILKQK